MISMLLDSVLAGLIDLLIPTLIASGPRSLTLDAPKYSGFEASIFTVRIDERVIL